MSKKAKKLKKERKQLEKKWAKQRAKRGYADVDVWNMDSWFINTAYKIMKKLRKNHMGYPGSFDFPDEKVSFYAINNEGEKTDGSVDGEKMWNDILDRMISLLRDMDEEKCTMKNPYEKEWFQAHKEFTKKYGIAGEKLRTEAEKEKEKETGSRRVYLPGDVPEYRDIVDKYLGKEREISEYRNQCKNEFFELFSKYFWDLWD